jgi:hypothetical protein
MATREQVRERLEDKLLGLQREGPGMPIEILELRVPEVYPSLFIELDVQVREEIWRVSLKYKGHEASLVSGDLTEEALGYLGFLARTHLFEWWHTKDTERASQRMGRRLA